MLGILNSRDIEFIKTRWSDPRSSKLTEALIRPSKAPTQAGSSNKGEDWNGGGYNTELSNVRARLNSPINIEKPNSKCNKIANLESSEQVIQDVISPAKIQLIIEDAQWPGVSTLLYGPPGSGKTHLATSLAIESKSTFSSICPADFVSKCLEDSEEIVADAFRKSRENAPSLIFIDEIDSLCGHCGESNGSEASKRIRAELLVQIQGVRQNHDRVHVIAATNNPYALDQAVRQLFNKHTYVRLPDLETRQQAHLGDVLNNLKQSDFEDFVQQTERFSFVDIAVCVKNVVSAVAGVGEMAKLFIPIVDEMRTDMKGFAPKITAPPDMTVKRDVMDTIAKHRPTVSIQDLEQYERYSREFGE